MKTQQSRKCSVFLVEYCLAGRPICSMWIRFLGHRWSLMFFSNHISHCIPISCSIWPSDCISNVFSASYMHIWPVLFLCNFLSNYTDPDDKSLCKHDHIRSAIEFFVSDFVSLKNFTFTIKTYIFRAWYSTRLQLILYFYIGLTPLMTFHIDEIIITVAFHFQ